MLSFDNDKRPSFEEILATICEIKNSHLNINKKN